MAQLRCALMGDVYAFVDQAAEGFASEQDRLWFEKHPMARERIREAYPKEMGGAVAMVRVIRIGPGMRAREPYEG